jgi:predicted XRE-type DNA-binding protein
MTEKIAIINSSGNVFKDLGYHDAEVEEMLAKADLASKINEILFKEMNLSQTEAAEILGLSQPNVSLLQRGILKDFSLERLVRFLSKLNQDIEIVIYKKHYAKNNKRRLFGHIRVAYA